MAKSDLGLSTFCFPLSTAVGSGREQDLRQVSSQILT